jgi:circadian clock protein KaiC
LIDGIADLRLATTDEVRFREYLYSLLRRCTATGVSLMLTLEASQGVPDVSDYGASNLSDNVVVLELTRRDSRMRRTITVLKTRASDLDPNGARVRHHRRRHRASRTGPGR